MELYSILLSQEAEVPAAEVASELARIIERPTSDVTRRLRDCPWILVEGVPAVSLDPIFEVLNGAGVSAKAVPEVHMPRIGPALRVREADPLPNAFFLQFAEQPLPPALQWEEVKLVSAGQVALTDSEAGEIFGAWKGFSKTGSAVSRTDAKVVGDRPETREPFLVDLIAEGDPLVRLRIEAGNFDYDYLKGRKLPQSRANFRQLVLDIRKRASNAVFTAPTESLMAGEPTRNHRFRSLRGFGAYTRWVLQAVEEAQGTEAE